MVTRPSCHYNRGLRPFVLAAMLAAGSAHAATIRGHVFDDTNGDGARDRGERGIANAIVAFGTEVFVEADADGAFVLEVVDDAAGIVWARVPEGFRAEAVWGRWSGSGEVDLGVHRLAHPLVQPITFVAASDAHLADKPGSPFFLGDAIERATAGAPAWFTILGDVTQGGRKEEFELVAYALGQLWGVPWIPVPGNHDWYDGGATWADRVGADNYSFDAAGVHFVVWNMALSDLAIEEFLRGDLARVKTPVVALTHAPPSPAIDDVLAALHIRYVLTGHAHSNRVVEHPGVTEYNTEPFLMGGLDFTPAGYRVMTLDHERLSSSHHVTVDAPFVAVMAPARGQCVPRSHGELIVAAELDATMPVVTARLDCGTPITLRWAGGWDWRAELPALAPGAHEVHVTATTTEARAETTATFAVCDPAPAPPLGPAWPQLGGDPAHTGATAHPLATTLAPRWVTPIGGHLLSASPAIARGLVYVTVTDLGDGAGGGVV
ncbi:MAG: metallophosphoesterase, partial [Kofleriaceae bacterium]